MQVQKALLIQVAGECPFPHFTRTGIISSHEQRFATVNLKRHPQALYRRTYFVTSREILIEVEGNCGLEAPHSSWIFTVPISAVQESEQKLIRKVARAARSQLGPLMPSVPSPWVAAAHGPAGGWETRMAVDPATGREDLPSLEKDWEKQPQFGVQLCWRQVNRGADGGRQSVRDKKACAIWHTFNSKNRNCTVLFGFSGTNELLQDQNPTLKSTLLQRTLFYLTPLVP